MPSAAVLAIAIWIIHVYAAIWVRGTISAMTRGTVTGGWGWRHHRKWLRKEVDKGEIETGRAVMTRSCSEVRRSALIGDPKRSARSSSSVRGARV